MADQSYRPNTEENEYQYQEEQEGGSYKYSEGQQAPKRKINLKPIIIVVIVLVVGFFSYKLITHRHQETSGDDLAVQLAPKQNNASQPAVANSQASAAATPTLANQAGNTAVVSGDIQKLQTMQSQTQDALNSLEKQQFQTQASVMAMQQSMDQVTGQLQTITQSLQVLNQDYQARLEKDRQAVLAKQRAQAQLRKDKQYFVSAVIPGRAWLKGADGSMLTVVVGDTIPGYGQVLAINPYSGAVTTEKGTLPYGQS